MGDSALEGDGLCFRIEDEEADLIAAMGEVYDGKVSGAEDYACIDQIAVTGYGEVVGLPGALAGGEEAAVGGGVETILGCCWNG